MDTCPWEGGIPKQIMINTLWNPLLAYRSMMECTKQFFSLFFALLILGYKWFQ